MTLHLINKALSHSAALSECLALLAQTESPSALLLIEDAVYSSADGVRQIDFTTISFPCYVLEEDLLARGIRDKVTGQFRVVDYAGFVQLTLEYSKVQSWA